MNLYKFCVPLITGIDCDSMLVNDVAMTLKSLYFEKMKSDDVEYECIGIYLMVLDNEQMLGKFSANKEGLKLNVPKGDSKVKGFIIPIAFLASDVTGLDKGGIIELVLTRVKFYNSETPAKAKKFAKVLELLRRVSTELLDEKVWLN